MITLHELWAAVTAPGPAAALEALARRELDAGVTREQLVERIAGLLPGLREQPGYADAWEYLVADLVDRLTGWTHPGSQLYSAPRS